MHDNLQVQKIKLDSQDFFKLKKKKNKSDFPRNTLAWAMHYATINLVAENF